MSKLKNEFDMIQYCIRLNLNNPDHLKVHNILRNLNKDVHKSQNAYIIESIIRNSENYSDEDMLSDVALKKRQQEEFVTKEYIDELEKKIHKDIMQEITALLLSTVVSNRIEVGAQNVSNVIDKTDNSEDQIDETLKDLSKAWA